MKYIGIILLAFTLYSGSLNAAGDSNTSPCACTHCDGGSCSGDGDCSKGYSCNPMCGNDPEKGLCCPNDVQN